MSKDSLLIEAGAKLRELRKDMGLSVHKVGGRVGVSGGYIAKIERGENNPSEIVLEGLAELYHKNTQELFDLYNKIESREIESFSKLHPEIRKTVAAISADENITDDEAHKIAKRMEEIAQQILNGEDK